MTPLTKTFLWSVAGGYFVVRSYQDFRYPSADLPWFAPYSLILLAGLAFFCAIESYRDRSPGSTGEPGTSRRELLTKTERIVFKTGGAFAICVGLAQLGLGGWLAWEQWIKVAQWPRADAVLISKNISSVGARLLFRYEAGGQRITGLGFRWGSERSVRTALETYEPGTVQKISYDPEDPSHVETILNYSWELFEAPVAAAVLGLLFIAGGVAVYRWSYGFPAANYV